jgi:hypothetical protein
MDSLQLSRRTVVAHRPYLLPEVGSAVGIRCDEENRIWLARPASENDRFSQRFSLCSRIPTLPVFAGQIFVCLGQVGDLSGLTVVKQFLARPQGDGVQVYGF